MKVLLYPNSGMKISWENLFQIYVLKDETQAGQKANVVLITYIIMIYTY